MVIFLLQDPSGAEISAAPIGIIQFGDDDTLAGRSMDKLPVAHIDAQMGNTAAAGVEEYQITGFQIAFGN